MITFKLLIWILVIAGFVWWNWYQIKKKKQRPLYLVENIIKGVILICWCSLIWQTKYEQFTAVLILWAVSTYWVLFDMALGVALHSDPLYVGKSSGWIDRFHYINNWTMVAYWVAKLIAVFT